MLLNRQCVGSGILQGTACLLNSRKSGPEGEGMCVLKASGYSILIIRQLANVLAQITPNPCPWTECDRASSWDPLRLSWHLNTTVSRHRWELHASAKPGSEVWLLLLLSL